VRWPFPKVLAAISPPGLASQTSRSSPLLHSRPLWVADLDQGSAHCGGPFWGLHDAVPWTLVDSLFVERPAVLGDHESKVQITGEFHGEPSRPEIRSQTTYYEISRCCFFSIFALIPWGIFLEPVLGGASDLSFVDAGKKLCKASLRCPAIDLVPLLNGHFVHTYRSHGRPRTVSEF